MDVIRSGQVKKELGDINMNSRERVLHALKVKEGMPNKIPLQFDLCRQLQEHFAAELGIKSTYTRNIFKDVTYRISGNEIRLALGSDVVVVLSLIHI